MAKNKSLQYIPTDTKDKQPGPIFDKIKKAVKDVKTTVNPKNWGVEDYTDKGNFNAAYSSARQNSEEEFMYKGKRYNTEYAGTPQQQLTETGIVDNQLYKTNSLQERLYKNLVPLGYLNKKNRVFDAVVKNEKDKIKDIPFYVSNERQDAYNLYMGKPQKNNTFAVSKYKPSISKDKDEVYYSLNNEKFKNDMLEVLDDKGNFLDYSGITSSNQPVYGNPDINKKAMLSYENVMGNFTLSKGSDEKGKYLSYYDIWDIEPMDFGKPFEVYDRIYYRENPDKNKYKEYDDKINELWNLAVKTQDEKYIDEASKLYKIKNSYYNKQGNFIRQYYSDKELSELDINKKNFDTLALQRELSNRGYSLPKSTKDDGTFDGILGDETKKALSDYQSKIKSLQYVPTSKQPSLKDGGRSDNFTTGGTWEILKEFKGASHARGGIDIEIGNGGIRMSGKDKEFKAAYGLIISKNNYE